MTKSTLRAAALVGMLAVLGTACVTGPYDEQTVSGGTFAVSGYTDQPNAPMIFKMYNFRLGTWDTVSATATVTSASTPSYGAGYWAPNSPALYSYQGSLGGYLDKYALGRSDYWDGVHARIEVFRSGNTQVLIGGSSTSVTCMLGTPKTGDFYTNAYNCGFDEGAIDIYANVIH